ncbi:hypothetical protein GOV12_00620 [Candidatus Pacearchaeota archaeon]|nr:hypothetical protein [Candidatus Pacearchaeota archaeon]
MFKDPDVIKSEINSVIQLRRDLLNYKKSDIKILNQFPNIFEEFNILNIATMSVLDSDIKDNIKNIYSYEILKTAQTILDIDEFHESYKDEYNKIIKLLKNYDFKDNLFPSEKLKGIKRKISGFIGIAGFIIGIFFLSPNITGNVIGAIKINYSNFIGILMIAISLIGIHLWLKNK